MFQLIAVMCLLALAIAQDDDIWTLYKIKHNKAYNDIEDPIRYGPGGSLPAADIVPVPHSLQQIFTAVSLSAADMVAVPQSLQQTNEEFATTMTGFRGNYAEPRNNPLHVVDGKELPHVTTLKEQGKCNSDYAFAAIGALEGQHFNATGKLFNISVQNIVDCSDAQCDAGCVGGDPNQVYVYVIENKGINTEECYPYKAKLNHGVLAVGYGADDSGNQYYIVKNSWGTDWGMKGYIWMSRNKDNQWGIDTAASYPID